MGIICEGGKVPRRYGVCHKRRLFLYAGGQDLRNAGRHDLRNAGCLCEDRELLWDNLIDSLIDTEVIL